MRYLPYICLLLLLGACASQSRTYSSEEKWERYDPDRRRTTYDDTYVHPSSMSADQLLKRAQDNEERGRDDKARVDYHTAFRRDRWHPEVNERYQDLMLRNDLFDTVWQEYVDLWQQHPQRGDAFWYHLRPMLIEREGTAIRKERAPKVSNDDLLAVETLVAEAGEATDNAGALAKLEAAIAIADLPELQIMRFSQTPPEERDALVQEYAERMEENPASGNAVGLHAFALAHTDPAAAIAELREAWILELPGLWLRWSLAAVCHMLDTGEDIEALGINDRRQLRGWLSTSLAFLNRFKGHYDGAFDILPPEQEITIRLSQLESGQS